METGRTVQTAFRFTPELVNRMKQKARREHKSVNAYVERLIEKDLGSGEDKYEALYRELSKIKLPDKISEEVKALSKYKVVFTREEVENDPKLEYFVEKYGLEVI